MRKRLVAFRPEVLDALEELLAAVREPSDVLCDEALLEVRRAKALYAGEGPIQLLPRRET